MLPTKIRPDLISQDVDKTTTTNDLVITKPTSTEDIHTKSPPKNLSKPSVITEAPKQIESPVAMPTFE
jgi:hypothetical protein